MLEEAVKPATTESKRWKGRRWRVGWQRRLSRLCAKAGLGATTSLLGGVSDDPVVPPVVAVPRPKSW